MKKSTFWALAALLLAAGCANPEPARPATYPVQGTGNPAILVSEFIYDEAAPTPSCHASTIEALPGGGLIAAWFGGTEEGNPDVGIWVSRRERQQWTPPVEAATGVQDDGKRFPCWNPVLFQPRNGPLMLFYKVGPKPSRWWGMLMTSDDGGKTWSTPRRLREGILGPIKNKPVQVADGSIICASSTEDSGWRVHMERSTDLGQTWRKTDSLNDYHEFGAIQPTIMTQGRGNLRIFCRTKERVITECWSNDDGRTWSSMKATRLPNPNSGIDAVTLRDGRQLLVYNHTTRGRSPLNVSVSPDAQQWLAALVLESQPGEYSYPAVIQTSDGLVHVTYTWNRKRIRHVVINPRALSLRPLVDGEWP